MTQILRKITDLSRLDTVQTDPDSTLYARGVGSTTVHTKLDSTLYARGLGSTTVHTKEDSTL